MVILNYILEGQDPVACEDTLTWARWYETADRKVASDHVGDVRISTVFLGLDHGWGEGEPVLFETMVFGGAMDEEMDRYCTWRAAETGHAAMVKRVALAR
jgi:hypothetical protein